jgi:glycosyltransferase involved in cell wall biosynthesis
MLMMSGLPAELKRERAVADNWNSAATAPTVVILQFGDYGLAYRRLQQDAPETYRDQHYSVNFVAELAQTFNMATMAVTPREHDELVAPQLRSMGCSYASLSRRRTLWRLLDTVKPQRVICRYPNHSAIAWAAARRIPLLPVFADVFAPAGIRQRWRQLRLARALSGALTRAVAPCVANHSLTASESLLSMGVPAAKIVPWECRALAPLPTPKTGPRHPGLMRLFFAGHLLESKGVGDLLQAMAILRDRGLIATLTLAGAGDTQRWHQMAHALEISDSIQFAGLLPADDVLQQMNKHDVVVVPSRPSYTEGLPNVIFEALASRTPLIISDHPAYVKRFERERDVLRFRAGNSEDLAAQVVRLAHDTSLYERLSITSPRTLSGLYVGTEWSQLVRQFLNDPANESSWVDDYCLLQTTEEHQAILDGDYDRQRELVGSSASQ